MTSSQGDVLILYTGGTIGSRPRDADDPTSPQLVVAWPEVEQGMKDIARMRERRGWSIDCRSSDPPLDSCNIGPTEWQAFGRIIEQNHDRYNGFVILHGTDTMVYTAAALSFMLRDLDKPVVLTGAQRSELVDVRNDAAQNLVTALEIANAKRSGQRVLPEVLICFGNVVLRGNRAVKRATSGYVAYESPNCEPLGSVGDAIEMREPGPRPRGSFRFKPRLDHRVLPIFIYPGITPDVVQGQLNAVKGLRAVIVQAYGSGNIPTIDPEFLRVFRAARSSGILVAIVTQCREGPVELGIYETSAQLLEAGFVSAYDITLEAAQCKLMSLLGDPDISLEETEADFQRSLAGEQSSSVYATELASEGRIDANNPRHRFPARSLSGQWDSGRIARALVRLRGAQVESNQKTTFRVFLDLDADAPPVDTHVGYAGRSNKWPMSEPGLVVFDVTERVRAMARPGQRVSFTIVLDSKDTALLWKRADLAVFTDERAL